MVSHNQCWKEDLKHSQTSTMSSALYISQICSWHLSVTAIKAYYSCLQVFWGIAQTWNVWEKNTVTDRCTQDASFSILQLILRTSGKHQTHLEGLVQYLTTEWLVISHSKMPLAVQ